MMKKGEIVLLILAAAAVLVFSGCSSPKDPTPQQATGCDWRPSSEQPFGLCKTIVGVYFDGKECKSIGGCPDEAAGKVPFSINGGMEECSKTCIKPAIAEEDQKKEFNMIAKQFSFEPSTITVKKGDTVKINLNSIDVDHGIGITEFNVNLKVGKGETKSVEFVADKAGTFTMFCNVFCGADHKDMKGTLLVEE